MSITAIKIPHDGSNPYLISLQTAAKKTKLDLSAHFLSANAKRPQNMTFVELFLANPKPEELYGGYRVYLCTDKGLFPESSLKWDKLNDYEPKIYGDMIVVKRDERAFSKGRTKSVVNMPRSFLTVLGQRHVRAYSDFGRATDPNTWVSEGSRKVSFGGGVLTLENWFRN